MSRFANHLIKQGLIAREQLENALQQQAVYGARLGTNLVELGSLKVEQVADALAAFHAVRLAPRKWLQRPQRAAVKRVSRPLVERVRFVPLRLDGNVMHVAVMDPRDPRVLDDLRFATGCRIQPYVLPEIWMHEWLLQLFQIPSTLRALEGSAGGIGHDSITSQAYDYTAAASFPKPAGAHVVAAAPAAPVAAARHAQASAVARGAATARAVAAASPPPHPRMNAPQPDIGVQRAFAMQAAPAPVPLPAEQAPFTVRSLGDLAALVRPSYDAFPEPAAEPAPRTTAFWQGSASLEEPLEEDCEETDIGLPDEEQEITLEAAPPSAQPPAPVPSAPPQPRIEPAVALMQLEAELTRVTERERLIEIGVTIGAQLASRLALFVVQKGTVQGLRCSVAGTPRNIDGVLVSHESNSMLADAAIATEARRVDPRARPFDVRVLELLGDPEALEVALFPVMVTQRIVNVLYASNGDQPVGAIAFAALATLAQQLGAGYESVIRSRKAAR